MNVGVRDALELVLFAIPGLLVLVFTFIYGVSGAREAVPGFYEAVIWAAGGSMMKGILTW